MAHNKEDKDLGTTRIYTADKVVLDGIGKRLEASSGLEATAPRVLRLAIKSYESALSSPAEGSSSQELASAIALLCQMYHCDSAKVRRIAANLQEELTHYEDTVYVAKETPAKGAVSNARKKHAG